MTEWISVKDRLPEPGSEVLTYEKRPDVSWEGCSVASYNPEMYQPGWAYVTHWMPLPKPPKKQKMSKRRRDALLRAMIEKKIRRLFGGGY